MAALAAHNCCKSDDQSPRILQLPADCNKPEADSASCTGMPAFRQSCRRQSSRVTLTAVPCTLYANCSAPLQQSLVQVCTSVPAEPAPPSCLHRPYSTYLNVTRHYLTCQDRANIGDTSQMQCTAAKAGLVAFMYVASNKGPSARVCIKYAAWKLEA